MKNSILIIVPTLNSYKLLPKLIKSLENQTSKSWRLIFVDGKSSKKHREYLEKVSKDYGNINYVFQDERNPYIYGAMNIGFNLVKPDEWFLFWGSDDWAYSKYVIEDLVKIINNPNYKKKDLIFNEALYVNTNNKKGRKASFKIINNLRFSLFLGFSPPHQGCLFSPNSLKKKNYYNTNYCLASDLDYFLSISKYKGLKAINLNKVIVKMRKGGASGLSLKNRVHEVFSIYKKEFGILFIIPFFLRYCFRIFQYLKK